MKGKPNLTPPKWDSFDPLISINITTYNRRTLLEKCLKSISMQTYKNYEIIIVDDYSTDDTNCFLRKEIIKNKKIKYFKNAENRGNAFSRNIALKESSGFLIAFMDDDDQWEDVNKLKDQKIFLQNNPTISLCYTGVTLYRDNKFHRTEVSRMPRNIAKNLLIRNGIINSPTVMTYKFIMEKVGGFDENIKRGVDSDFYRNCLLNHDLKFGHIEKLTTKIFQDSTSKNNLPRFRMTNSYSSKNLLLITKMHAYTLLKYFRFYLISPKSLLFRIMLMAKSLLKALYIIFIELINN